jgi:hypothetical protein
MTIKTVFGNNIFKFYEMSKNYNSKGGGAAEVVERPPMVLR